MTEAIISALPEVLKKHICTLKRASTDTTHSDAMCESNIKVVNFDKIPNEYARGKGWKVLYNFFRIIISTHLLTVLTIRVIVIA